MIPKPTTCRFCKVTDNHPRFGEANHRQKRRCKNCSKVFTTSRSRPGSRNEHAWMEKAPAYNPPDRELADV